VSDTHALRAASTALLAQKGDAIYQPRVTDILNAVLGYLVRIIGVCERRSRTAEI
jgi:hypothetical protein